MSADDLASEAARWLRYAEGDLSSARKLAQHGELPARNVCLLAQQAAEKAIKAVLVRQAVDFPRTHDLDALVEMLRDDSGSFGEIDDMAELSQWAVESRYPGNWSEPTEDDARGALNQAAIVVKAAVETLATL